MLAAGKIDRFTSFRAALVTAMLIGGTFTATAQTSPNPLQQRRTPAAATAPTTTAPAANAPATETKADKPKSAGALRRTKCSEEYQAAKAANKLNGQKWPQFYSACNKRLKAAG